MAMIKHILVNKSSQKIAVILKYSQVASSVRSDIAYESESQSNNSARYFWKDPQFLNFSPDNETRQNDITNLYKLIDNIDNKKVKHLLTKNDYFSECCKACTETNKCVSLNAADNLLDVALVTTNLSKYDNWNDFKKKLELLYEHNVPDERIEEMSILEKSDIITKNFNNFENELCFLKEIGANFKEYRTGYGKRILSKDISVLKSLYKLKIFEEKYLKALFRDLGAPEHVIKSLPCSKKSRNFKFQTFWTKLIQKVFGLRFEMDENHPSIKNFLYKLYNSPQSLFRYVSLITIVQDYFEIDTKKIIMYQKATVLNSLEHVRGIRDMLESLEDPSERKFIISCIQHSPKILLLPHEHIKSTLMLIKYVNIPIIHSEMKIETFNKLIAMNPLTLCAKIEKLINVTSLTDLRLTPKSFLYFTFSDSNINNEDLLLKANNLLFLPHPTRNKKNTIQTIRFAYDFIIYNFDIDMGDVREAVLRIRVPSLPNMEDLKQNFVFLLQNGISFNDLKETFHVLLFAHDILVVGYQEFKSCPIAQELKKNGQNDRYMQLLLYYMLKRHKYLNGNY